MQRAGGTAGTVPHPPGRRWSAQTTEGPTAVLPGGAETGGPLVQFCRTPALGLGNRKSSVSLTSLSDTGFRTDPLCSRLLPF